MKNLLKNLRDKPFPINRKVESKYYYTYTLDAIEDIYILNDYHAVRDKSFAMTPDQTQNFYA